MRRAMKPKQFKALRKKLGLSLAQAAEQIHVSPRTIARWESGERHLPEGVIHLFCLVNKVRYPQK